ncbi:MAG TPA: magnesium transporter [Gemmatimonadaceae bacterium]|nr:magnesium transporter [Gemmatimonadaceae bacterium]
MIETSRPELLYLLAGDPAELAETLSEMRPADVADALNQLSPEAAAAVIKVLPFDVVVRVFDDPEFEHRHEVFDKIDADTAAPIIEAMSGDQQADLFRELTETEQQRLLPSLDSSTRQSLSLLLKYSPKVAGGIMTTEFASVPANWNAAQTLAYLAQVGDAKETIYAIYIMDEQRRLVHVISLRELVMVDSETPIVDIGVRRTPITVTPQTSREDVARLISKYDLLAVPVLDEGGHVLGIVTVDDVIDAMVRETTEDVQKLGGMEALDEPYMDMGFFSMIKKRAGWLCALFLGEMLTATAMGYFEGEISKAVVLALFIPLIISSGGNSGSQATSLIIRAMALREVTLRDWWRVASRELPSGIALGAILGVIGITRILLWQTLGWYDYGVYHVLVALTVGCALVGVVTFGSLAGSMLPFVLRRLGFDPASASAPFVATLVDVTGLVIYFTVAFVIMRGTLL